MWLILIIVEANKNGGATKSTIGKNLRYGQKCRANGYGLSTKYMQNYLDLKCSILIIDLVEANISIAPTLFTVSLTSIPHIWSWVRNQVKYRVIVDQYLPPELFALTTSTPTAVKSYINIKLCSHWTGILFLPNRLHLNQVNMLTKPILS